jgi:hypothetical protein
MGGSYALLLTAFYVDNGPSLPLWNRLPPPAYWLIPNLIAAPLILRYISGRRAVTLPLLSRAPVPYAPPRRPTYRLTSSSHRCAGTLVR